MISLPAPARDPALVFSLLGTGPAFFWRGPNGPSIVGSGSAQRFSAEGLDRFARIRQLAEPVLAKIKTFDIDPPGDLEPRLFGGFAFQVGGTDDAVWNDFEDACFILPRLRYVRSESAAHLSLVLTPIDLQQADHAEHWLSQLLLLRARIERIASVAARREPIEAPAPVDAVDLEIWNGQVASILDAIAQGCCDKVVLARCAELRSSTPIDVGEALALLANQTPEAATCFGFRFGGSTFVGATPERLVAKRGLDVRSEALAGSVRTGDEERARELLHDPKELREHQLVVSAILQALAPWCEHTDSTPAPEVRRLRHLLHLRTPIIAKLKEPVHVLDLVARLHPTPAVGGVPTEWATTWISRHESRKRGWYAGPFGWFNAVGDGEIDVALRSGLIKGQTAYLYAGAGIVKGSNAASEHAETRFKLAAMLSALRVR